MDQRWKDLAKVLVNYSVEVKKGDKVLITMMEVETWDLARACYQEVVKAGGKPFIEFQSAYLESDLMRLGDEEQVAWINDMHMVGMDWADCYIGLRGARNPAEFEGIPADVVASHKHAMGVISSERNRTRWVLSRVPNESFAQQAGMTLDDMMDFYFASTVVNWDDRQGYFEKVRDLYEGGKKVRIVGKETDITFSTVGRTYAIAGGRCNMPDGEVYTSPDETTVNGKIYFEFPGVYAGKVIQGIRLEFKDGKLVNYSSETEQDFLETVLHMDDGAKRVGEFGIGLNAGINRYCYDILYDEKIGGTIHLAMGRAYPKCGGTNDSSLHWDIIKDLREEGEVYVDSRLVMKNGVHLIK